jgi:hypothetical protein
MQPVESQPTFQRNMPPPSSGLKSSACYLLHAGFLLGLFFDLKIEVTCSSETSVDFLHITRHYIQELFITTAVRTSDPTKVNLFV